MINPSGSAFGYVHHLCTALVGRGAQVDLYTGPFWDTALRGLPVPSYRHRQAFYRHTFERSRRPGPTRPLWRAARLVEHVRGLARIARAQRAYDVTHVQWLPVPALDARALKRLCRRGPVAYTIHDVYPHDVPETDAARSFWANVYASPHALIAHSQADIRELTSAFDVPPARLHHVLHGNFGYLRHHPIRTHESPTDLLFFGFIGHYKGLDVLLDALARLRDAGHRFSLRVVGRPLTTFDHYQRQIDRLGLSDLVDVRLGFIDERDIQGHFTSTRLVVLPYRRIGQSGVAITATTLGRALVASQVGGLGELVETLGNGLTVPVDDASALADAIEKLLTDDAFRAGCEAASLQHADTTLAWGPIADATLAAYDAARSSHGRGQ